MGYVYLCISLPAFVSTFLLDGLPKILYMNGRMSNKLHNSEKYYSKFYCEKYNKFEYIEYILYKNDIKETLLDINDIKNDIN